MLDDPEFTPSAFFARAAARLARDPPAREADALGDHVLNPGFVMDGGTYRDAAVLIPVVAREPQATMLLTLRTEHLPAHAGQIAFPGGKIEAGDQGAAGAALREAEEEIGLAPGKVEIIGYLDPYLTGTGYRIVPVLGRVDAGHGLSLNPNEVVEAFEVPLSFLMSSAKSPPRQPRVAGRAAVLL